MNKDNPKYLILQDVITIDELIKTVLMTVGVKIGSDTVRCDFRTGYAFIHITKRSDKKEHKLRFKLVETYDNFYNIYRVDPNLMNRCDKKALAIDMFYNHGYIHKEISSFLDYGIRSVHHSINSVKRTT